MRSCRPPFRQAAAPAVEDLNLGLRGDAEHGGRLLESNRFVEARREDARRAIHNHDRRAVIDADDTAKPVVYADDIAWTKPSGWRLAVPPDNADKPGLSGVARRFLGPFHITSY
jgi:hypothetical protein